MDLQDAFLQLALLGANWVLWILVALSIASVAIVIERWLFFRGLAGQDSALLDPVSKALADGDIEERDIRASRPLLTPFGDVERSRLLVHGESANRGLFSHRSGSIEPRALSCAVTSPFLPR